MILKRNIPLKDHSNYKIGGLANYFFEFKSCEDLKTALSEYKKIDPSLKTVFVLGKGTNVLFSDKGFSGLVLKNALSGISLEFNQVSVSSGILMEQLVYFSTNESISGFEWAGGLPGTVGGAIRGNAGAFGGEIKDNLVEVISLCRNDLKTKVRNNLECEFDYRQSIFKKNDGENEIILSAKFAIEKGNGAEIKEKTQERINYRILKHPLEYPNIGSIFKNIPIESISKDVLEEFKNYIKNDPFPVLPVAKLIVCANLMGKRIGDAQISEKHPNFIVNLNNASAGDVIELMKIIREKILNKYKINLEEEITIL